MNNDLLNISLNQGKQFNSYQTKIKKNINTPNKGYNNKSYNNKSYNYKSYNYKSYNNKRYRREGFTTGEQQPQTQSTTSQEDLDEYKELKSKYDKLMMQYILYDSYINNQNSAGISRVSSNNPYLNKNLLFKDGTLCYVTNKGIAKPYANKDDYTNTVGKNGCPPEGYITMDISWSEKFIEGSIIPTKPPLIVGSKMVSGQSCGNEGSNIYVNKYIPDDVTPSYMGCFSASPNNDNMTFIGDKPNTTTIAIENGNFSQTQIANDSFRYLTWDTTTIPGWNFNCVILNNSSAWGYPMPYPNGSQCASIQKNQELWTSGWFKFSPGITYTISFDASGRNCCDGSGEANPIDVGLEGKTIYSFNPPVNKWTKYSANFTVETEENVRISFKGTWTSSDRSTAIQGISIGVGNNTSGNYTYEQCKNEAINNGYQFFALQNVNTTTSKGYCAVSNNSPGISEYGESFVPSKLITIWSSNTSGQPGNTVSLNNTGSLEVIDSSGKVIYATPASTVVDSGYLGCYADKSDRAMANTSNNAYYPLEKCKELAIEQGYKYYAGQNVQSDSSVWCAGSNDLASATKYGLATNCVNRDGVMLGGGWSNSIYSVEPGGDFYLILKDDGNMCIHRGTDPNNDQGQIWCSETSGKQKSANPNMEASKGKYGKNWMPTGSTLVMGDFISSTNGDLVLIMQEDGNLVLNTYDMELNCKKMNDGNMGGGINANAAYDIKKTAFPQNMGLLAYIDPNSTLKQYPDSMIGFTNDYQIYKNTDSPGNDLMSINATNEQECQTGCNDNVDCAGYVYNSTTSTCLLKSRNQFKRQSYDSSILGIRTPKINGTNSCGKDIVNVDTIQYENYVKGDKMTSDSECNISLISQEDRTKFDSIKSELYTLGQDIASKMESLYNQNNKVYEELDMNSEQFNKDLEKYKNTIQKIQNLESSNNVEGMENYGKNLSMSDLNGMLTDSDLMVIQENSSYILWSILAVGLVTITLNAMNK